MVSIAGDIGGTKSWLIALRCDINGMPQIIHESRYQSQRFENIDVLLHQFINELKISNGSVEQMVLAVPGPITSDTITLTNLNWQISAVDLQQQFAIPHVQLLNDFQATALGTLTLSDDGFSMLNSAKGGNNRIRLVLGAGTGLGMSYLYRKDDDAVPVATEGGHVDFAPTDVQQIELLKYLQRKFSRVSYERILSGSGLVELFNFLAAEQQSDPSVTAEWISRAANDEGNLQAQETLRLFSRIYGSFVGNMVLAIKPGDGVYLTGGMTAKVNKWLEGPEFIDAYLDKGRMLDVVIHTPIYLVTNERVGLEGAMNALDLDKVKQGMLRRA